MKEPQTFARIQEAIDDIRAGKMVVVVDDETRENEGDLVMAANKVMARDINFMAKEGRGLICVPVTQAVVQQLELYPMVKKNTETFRTNFTISVDYRHGTTTGISASDRAKTIQAIASSHSRPDDFAQPGHVFPLLGMEGGVLERAGHTEATLDLIRLADCGAVGVLCEIAQDDGEMARLPYLKKFARKHGLRIISIEGLIAYLKAHE